MDGNNTTVVPEITPLPLTLTTSSIIAFLICAMVVLTTGGNLLVIIAFATQRSLRNFSDYLILNLAVSDFLVGSISIPFYAPYVLTGTWHIGRALCFLWLVVDYVIPAASTYNICIISLDKYIQIAYPFWARSHRTYTMMFVFLLIPWLIPAFVYMPLILLWEPIGGKISMPPGQCFVPYYDSMPVLFFSVVFEFLIPFIIVGVLNIMVYESVRKRYRRLQGLTATNSILVQAGSSNDRDQSTSVNVNSSNDPTSHQQIQTNGWHRTAPIERSIENFKRDQKAARSLFTIIFVFGICWIPYEIASLIRSVESTISDTSSRIPLFPSVSVLPLIYIGGYNWSSSLNLQFEELDCVAVAVVTQQDSSSYPAISQRGGFFLFR
ncbi:hypothetical protein CHS0354_022435 [Potamilus streckersoni]|uniref:G-protein coupled receptors family 1 profile domain-containing protein n=1 Tax=Potamilus streckersoni TaxID=2493646 RepID=A0AAE0W2P2_9BIVA|nr:hypothetical protein CHS0354_022435 [Potamilus streckersoni]